MAFNQQQLSEAATAIQTGSFTPQSLHLIDSIVDQRAATNIISEMVSNEQAAGKSDPDAVSYVMRHLERLGGISKPTACILMVHLFANANKLMMHEITDAIDLWVHSCDADKLTQELQTMAQSEPSADERRRYQRQMEIQRVGMAERQNRAS